MPAVKILCPTTNELISTHVEADSLDDVEPTNNLRMNCPNCGRDHEWTVADAVLGND